MRIEPFLLSLYSSFLRLLHVGQTSPADMRCKDNPYSLQKLKALASEVKTEDCIEAHISANMLSNKMLCY